jgi:hypothetical protein
LPREAGLRCGERGHVEDRKRANLLLLGRSPLDSVEAYDDIRAVWIGGRALVPMELEPGRWAPEDCYLQAKSSSCSFAIRDGLRPQLRQDELGHHVYRSMLPTKVLKS